MTALVPSILALAAGTYAFRVAGPYLRDRFTMPAHAEKVIAAAAAVMLTAVVATAALYDGDTFAGVARPAGVLVAGILAIRKVPFVVIVLAAAAPAGCAVAPSSAEQGFVLEQAGPLDALVTPVGGGGLISGVASAVKQKAATLGRTVRIEGHADASGTPEANQALSERRAQTVRALLARHHLKGAF